MSKIRKKQNNKKQVISKYVGKKEKKEVIGCLVTSY